MGNVDFVLLTQLGELGTNRGAHPDRIIDNMRRALACRMENPGGRGEQLVLARLPCFGPAHQAAVSINQRAAILAAVGDIKADPVLANRFDTQCLVSIDRSHDMRALADVRAAAARAVRPQTPDGTGAHRTLLDLARAPGGDLRLVTTNFDRLFQSVDPNLRCHLPPTLPDLRRADLWTGLVYLHGRASDDYAGADAGDFVLSSADFGRAYMSDGWATAFMRSLIDHYQIVFVGYSADDPPVQYLLEAISRTRGSSKLYAFHPGGAEQAAALWRHKGVVPIPHGDYPALWRSLDAWAIQARDPAAWGTSVVATAQKGPREIAAHERGQVAHLVSTLAGAQDFCRAEPSPPAEWLCVFDPYGRAYGPDS